TNFPDVYVSCDVPFAERVREYFEGITNILDNDLVIIVPKGNPKNIKPSLEELKRDDLNKIGLPNPAHYAMGERIAKTLQNLGFPPETWDASKSSKISNTSSADLLVGQ